MSKNSGKSSNVRKSGGTKPNPPEPDMDTLMDEAKNLVKAAKQQMDLSGNLKTTIKETVLKTIYRLYDIVDLLNESRLQVKNNLEIVIQRRKAEKDPDIVTILEAIRDQNAIAQTTLQTIMLLANGMDESPKIEEVNEKLGKITEEIKRQSDIGEKTQQEIQEFKEDIKTIKEIQMKPNTIEIESPIPKTYAEVVTEKPRTTHCLLVGESGTPLPDPAWRTVNTTNTASDVNAQDIVKIPRK
ncbi:unnamed protein product, partial [Brenthis ino]